MQLSLMETKVKVEDGSSDLPTFIQSLDNRFCDDEEDGSPTVSFVPDKIFAHLTRTYLLILL